MHRLITFIALAFGVSWSIAIGGWFLVARSRPELAPLLPVAMMMGPAVAAIVCALIFDAGRRIAALGLSLRPNGWWLVSYIAGLALPAIAVGATLALSGRHLADIGLAAVDLARQSGQDVQAAPGMGMTILFSAITIGALVNAPMLTLSEELGWRGYMFHALQGAGFWRIAVFTGFIWGIWHVPAILLYGVNYADHRFLGAGLFVGFCILLSPLLTLVRMKGKSVVASGVLHGTLNAAGPIASLAISDPSFPWDGMVGVGGFAALGISVVFVALAVAREKTRGGGPMHAAPPS